jgi:hypothetical protein
MVGTFFNFSILLFIRRKHRSEDRNSVNFFFFFFYIFISEIWINNSFTILDDQLIYSNKYSVKNIWKYQSDSKIIMLLIHNQRHKSKAMLTLVQSQVLSQNDPNPQSNLTLDQFDFVYNSLRLIIIKKYSIKKYFVNINSDSMASWL